MRSPMLSLWALGAAAAAAATVDEVRVVVPTPVDPVTARVAGVLARQITARCQARVSVLAPGAPASAAVPGARTVELTVAPGIGTEGFTIADRPAGGVRITGNDGAGLLAGVGRYLRCSRFDQGGFTPGPWRGTSVPAGTFRAVYAATHFMNIYEAAPLDDMVAYLEDLGLWGANTVITCFPPWTYDSLAEARERGNLGRTRDLLRAARAVGLRPGIVIGPNQGYKSAPPAVRATRFPDDLGRHGFFGANCCPSAPGGRDYLLQLYAEAFDAYADIGLDWLVLWPYDEGGCGCPNCWPWGARGYPTLCRDVAALARQRFPAIRIVASTWTFDTPPCGEWEGFARSLARDGAWADAIMADSHTDFPRYPLDVGVPNRLPLFNFPEISMWGRSPWGGYGANPLPARLQTLWDQTAGKVSGGMPYSEGIYEDLNKAICLQFYWDPRCTAEQTLREYLAFEFSPDVVDDLVSAVRILEATWPRVGPESAQALQLVSQVETRLTPQARTAWRWRILALRARIDSEMHARGGRLEGPVLREAFAELTRLYHAENAHSMPVRPPQVAP